MMEEQLKENPDVLLKKITDLQNDKKVLQDENIDLRQKFIKLQKETMVLQEFVVPGNEKIRMLSSYLKEWKDRYLLLNEEKMNLEIENEFKSKKIETLLSKDREKMIINLTKDKEKYAASSSKWYFKYQETYSDTVTLEREIANQQSKIVKQQSEIVYLKNKLAEYDSVADGSV